MPFPNYHAARLKNPDLFDPDTYKTIPGGTLYNKIKVPQTINIVWAKYKNKTGPSDPVIAQSLRFKKANWTVEQAKQWLSSNKINFILFEPAKEDAKARQALATILYLKRRLKCPKS
jgi:hypothetical protein